MTKALLFIALLLVRTEAATKPTMKIKVMDVENGNKLICEDKGHKVYKDGMEVETLRDEEESSGEYYCSDGQGSDPSAKIFVKFQTCENCITLDVGTATGVVTANIVATFLIGLAVYLITAQSRALPASGKKASDRRGLIANESNPNSHYQELRPRDRDVYSTAARRQ